MSFCSSTPCLVCLVIHNFRVQLPTLLHGPQPGEMALEKIHPRRAGNHGRRRRRLDCVTWSAVRGCGASGSFGGFAWLRRR